MKRTSILIVSTALLLAAAQADAITILRIFTIRSYLSRDPDAQRRHEPLYVIAEILDADGRPLSEREGFGVVTLDDGTFKPRSEVALP